MFFIRYGLADTATGVVLVQLMPTVPYAATVLAAAFANLDTDYERQARALGAGPVRVLLFVTLPLLRPALLLAALFAFLISWSEYVLTLLIGGGQVRRCRCCCSRRSAPPTPPRPRRWRCSSSDRRCCWWWPAPGSLSGRSGAVIGFGSTMTATAGHPDRA